MRKAWTKAARNMRAISLTIVLGGVTILALSFLARAVADEGFSAKGLKGTYAFRMVPVKSFSADNASLSGLDSAPYQDILRVGVFTATPDTTPGAATGSLSGKTIATIDNNSGSTRVVVFSWTGHYGMNADGTGVFTVDAPTTVSCFDSTSPVAPPGTSSPYPPPPPSVTCPTSVEGPESYAFVIGKGHHDLQFIQTDNDGGGAKIFLTGEGRKRERED